LHKENFDPKRTEIILSDNIEIGYWTMDISDSKIYIENLILGAKYQNNGLGTKLMGLIIQKSEKEKKTIGLSVLKEK